LTRKASLTTRPSQCPRSSLVESLPEPFAWHALGVTPACFLASETNRAICLPRSNPFAGLDSIGGGNGPRRNHYARQSSTDSEASFGGIGGLPSQSAPMGRSRSGRSTASAMGAVGTAGGRRRNQPASDMSLGGGYDSLTHGGGGGGKSSRAPSIASTQYPTTTTAASKSRRSTLMSQTTAFTDHSELVPPSPSRFKGAYGSYKGPGTHNIPSPPSSVASSAAPQIYPETPAQREARRRSTERSRPVNYSSSLPVAPPLSAILPPRPRPALESAFSGSERGGGGGGESSTGATSHYVPTKWKEERELKRGGVDEEFRPQEKEKEYRPAVGDNMKRSWNEISLAVRFGSVAPSSLTSRYR
jgi:hypothetical protein